MKLLVDMNLSPSWIERLAQHGFEVVHWSTVGALTAGDDEILSWARVNGLGRAEVRSFESRRHLNSSAQEFDDIRDAPDVRTEPLPSLG